MSAWFVSSVKFDRRDSGVGHFSTVGFGPLVNYCSFTTGSKTNSGELLKAKRVTASETRTQGKADRCERKLDYKHL